MVGIAHEVKALQTSNGANEFGLGAGCLVDPEHLQAGKGITAGWPPSVLHE